MLKERTLSGMQDSKDIIHADLEKTVVDVGWAAVVERVWEASGVVTPDLRWKESRFR